MRDATCPRERAHDDRSLSLILHPPLALPVLELGIAVAEGEDGVGQAPAFPLGRVNADQHGAVSAALDIPGVRFHTQP
jgi:hypothetical protein